MFVEISLQYFAALFSRTLFEFGNDQSQLLGFVPLRYEIAFLGWSTSGNGVGHSVDLTHRFKASISFWVASICWTDCDPDSGEILFIYLFVFLNTQNFIKIHLLVFDLYPELKTDPDIPNHDPELINSSVGQFSSKSLNFLSFVGNRQTCTGENISSSNVCK